MRLPGLLTGLCLIVLTFVSPPAPAAQEIKPFVRGSFQQIVAARQGRPFIVDFWSLSCGYCMAELDMLKKLAGKYPRLDLVLVSTDTLEEKETWFSATIAKFSPARPRPGCSQTVTLSACGSKLTRLGRANCRARIFSVRMAK